MPLTFAPTESAFIVFQSAVGTVGTNLPSANAIQTSNVLPLTGPWQVAFDTNWGGPASIMFTNLTDWTARPEAGIKYYSGQAVYRQSFRPANPGLVASNTHLYVSLGNVQNMASVGLNGTAMGVVWCPPWQLEIPAPILQAGSNTLEVTVANL